MFIRTRDSLQLRESSSTGVEGTVALGDRDSEPEKVFTVDDAIESIGMGPFQVIILSVAGLVWVSRTHGCVLAKVAYLRLRCKSHEPGEIFQRYRADVDHIIYACLQVIV